MDTLIFSMIFIALFAFLFLKTLTVSNLVDLTTSPTNAPFFDFSVCLFQVRYGLELPNSQNKGQCGKIDQVKKFLLCFLKNLAYMHFIFKLKILKRNRKKVNQRSVWKKIGVSFTQLLVAKLLYKSKCPSVCPSVNHVQGET